MTQSLESVLALQPDWFRQRIIQAATWANAALTKARQLRSDALDPAAFGAESFRGGRGNIPTAQSVETLVRRRMEQMKSERDSSDVVLNPHAGKLLIFTPQDSLSDGAATVASDGFFDVDNVPAWDTWLYFDGHTLVSWIPPHLISKVQSGIDVNPEGCIRWADQTPT